MAERKIVVIDAGHGGADPGAKFEGRQEKDDALRLALAVGKILSDNGVDVRYTRTDDTYNTPLEKATMANEAGADYFVSIHRNAMPIPGSASGVMSLVFENKGVPAQLANNINEELANTGFAGESRRGSGRFRPDGQDGRLRTEHGKRHLLLQDQIDQPGRRGQRGKTRPP